MQRAAKLMICVLAAGLVSGAAGAVALLADAAPVDVQVLVIRATTKNKDISPELKELADKLRKQFKYTGFKLVKQAASPTPIGSAYTTALAGGYEASITPQKRDGKRLTLQIRVLKKGEDRAKLDMTATIPAGEFQLTGGWELDAGDALIVGFAGK